MKKRFISLWMMLVVIAMFIAPCTHATIILTNDDIMPIIEDMQDVRKQYMALLQAGYYNHVEEKSNESLLDLANLQTEKIQDIKQEINNYKAQDLDKFSSRKMKTLNAVTLFLADMGLNLTDYLSAEVLEDQYAFHNIQLQINQFIIGILADVENSQY